MSWNEIRKLNGFHYLGSPYSLYPDGIEEAHAEVCRIAGKLIALGLSVHCPIAHSHSIAHYAALDPLDHEIWLPAERALMDSAASLIVVKMDTWRDSYGIGVEVDVFRNAGKPIFYLNPSTMDLSDVG